MVLAALAGLLLSLAGAVSVEGDDTCLDASGFTRDLEARLPSEVELEEISVLVRVGAEAPEGPIQVVLLVEGGQQPPLQRALEINRAGCGSLGRLLSHVVARHLAPADLPPQHDLSQPAPASPEPERVVPPAPECAPEVVAERTLLALRPQFGFGVGAGVSPLIGDVRLELGFTFGHKSWPSLVAVTRVSLSQPLSLGGGEAQLAHGVVGLGGSSRFDLGAITLSPRLLAVAGPALAWGNGFAIPEAAFLPHVAALGSLSLYTRAGFFADAGGEVVLTPPLLATRHGARVQLGFLTMYVQAGFAWDLDVGGGIFP